MPVGRVAAMSAAAVMLATAVPAAPASAQGLFDALFGGFDRGMRRQLPPRAHSYSDPSGYYDGRERRYS